MNKKIRVLILLFILLFVALEAWLSESRSTDWNEPLWVVIYPVNGDQDEVTSYYIENLTSQTFNAAAEFMSDEAYRYAIGIQQPIRVVLADELSETPPSPPNNGNIFSVIYWSLKIRFWASGQTKYSSIHPDIQLFVQYFNPEVFPNLSHSYGLQKGRLGVINAFASSRMESTNNVIIVHELLHTVGATDKYDLQTNQPILPIGYAEPNKVPLYPQSKAEIMGGRIPLSANDSEIPRALNQTTIGRATATEIKWINQ